MFFFGGGKGQGTPGSRVPPTLPVRILTSYARTFEEVQLFSDDLAACTPAKHLEWEDALEAFPDGAIPSGSFDANGCRWQLVARSAADGRKVLHMAVPAEAAAAAAPAAIGGDTQQERQLQTVDSEAMMRWSHGNASEIIAAAGPKGHRVYFDSPMERPGSASEDDGNAYSSNSWSGDGALTAAASASKNNSRAAGAAARRKYVRDIVVATNPAHDSLGRYKALIALIEHCKTRARVMRPGMQTDWGREPANSLLHAIVDVGEALAGFGNANFPERSGEARAVLAADYKALLSEYLMHLGGVLVPGACRGVAPDVEAELRSVSSLLSTRCAAYKVLYEQLVRNVGTEGSGKASAAPCLIFNTNSNSVDASPVTTNTNTAEAESKAKAINAGISAAALAALALGVALVVRTLTRGSGGGGRQRRGEQQDGSRNLRLPRGRNGREMALVSSLAACGDELRKAGRNEELLHDDWRIGRVRLAWPPAPEPPGYAPLAKDVCDITGVLQDLYGR